MYTDPSLKLKDADNWVKSTFVIQLGKDFTTYKEVVAYALAQSDQENDQPSASDQAMLSGGVLPVYFSKQVCRDTSLGGNDAVNCYYAFNEDDDIAHPFTMADYGTSGMGRVYKEIYHDTQQVMWLAFGTPAWNNLSSFYMDCLVPNLASIMNKGKTDSGASIGELLGQTAATFVKLPVMPLLWLNRWLGGVGNVKITKYYDFAQAMPLYYQFVNSMLIHLAVNMGLCNDGHFMDGGNAIPSTGRVPSTTTSMTHEELAKQSQQRAGASTNDGAGLPEIMRMTNFDILKILGRRWIYESGADPSSLKSTDESLKEWLTGNDGLTDSSGDKSYFEQMLVSFDGAIHDAPAFVGFRIEKSTDSSESLSNQTGVSEIAQTVNAKIQGARNFNFSTAMGNISDGAVGQLLEGFLGSLKDFAKGVGEVTGLRGITAALAGAGLIDFPEVWQDSNFTKNYSFTMELRAPAGDPYTIFQTIYVPLCMILAGALPRATGPASYSAPFLVRAYSKGMFAVPMGIIDSITITRGADQYGWNMQRLPTVVRLSFTIKDLSPAMYMAMADSGGAWDTVFGQNSTFQEYLLTLSGMGLQDRLRFVVNARRKAQIMLQTFYANRLSPHHWGLVAADSIPGRLYSVIVPATGLPNS